MVTVPVKEGALVSGAISETDQLRFPSDRAEPLALCVPQPNRYLANCAVTLAWGAILRGEKAMAEGYLNEARGWIAKARFEKGTLDPRFINLELAEIEIESLELHVHSNGKCRRPQKTLDTIDQLKVRINEAFEADRIPPSKLAEWQTEVHFAEFAIRTQANETPDASMMLRLLENVISMRGHDHAYIFWFDPIYQFALWEQGDLFDQFKSVLKPR